METVKQVQTKPKTGLSRLMELAGKKKVLIIGAAVLSALASIASFVPYLAIFYIIREVTGVYPDFSQLDRAKTISYGWLAFGGVLANVLFYFGALMCSHLAAFATLYDLKLQFSKHIAGLPLGFHLTIGSGKLRKIMDENIEKIEGFIAHQFPDLVASFVAPLVMLVILMVVDWRFGLAALVGIGLAFFVEFIAYGNDGAKSMMDKYQSSLENMNNATVEYIRGITVVKAFKQTVYSFRRLHETIKEYTGYVIPYTLSWENYMSGFTTLINNIYLFLIPVGIVIGLNSTDYVTYALTFIFYLLFVPSIASVMMKIMYVSSASLQITGGVQRMDEILQMSTLPASTQPQTCAYYDIAFEHVSFSYDPAVDVQALDQVSFTAKQNQITAIVGPSGGGKSTIAHLLPRFYDVSSGVISIGGTDIRTMEHAYLMDKVSFVFQDVFLFKQSVMDNIRFGNLQASNQEVIAAAQCHDFIERLPQGYQTVIGQNGVHLSGGERQRLAIARAIIKNAPILVLDEATAFADPENEHLIQKAFEKLMQNKTVIIIAHRLSTVRSADQIIVMDQGKLIQQGTHAELTSQAGKYREMWQLYNQTLNWKLQKEVNGNA